MGDKNKLKLKQVAIILASVFCFALALNWAVLKLFGQKSADRFVHSLVGIILLITYASFLVDEKKQKQRVIPFFLLALIPCYLGTVFPDLDITFFGIGGHRNPLFHSSLSFFVLMVFIGRKNVLLQTVVRGYGIGLASHLLWDMLDNGDVRWLPGGSIDRLWLGVNGLLCLIPSGSKRLLSKG